MIRPINNPQAEIGVAQRLPVQELAELRRTAPIWWNEQPLDVSGFADGGYWLVSKHHDVREGCRYADIGGEGLIEEDQEVRYRTSISAYSREVLAATFNTHIEDLPDFPFTKSDPLIVNRHNPLDR